MKILDIVRAIMFSLYKLGRVFFLYLHWVRYCYGFEKKCVIAVKVICIKALKEVSHWGRGSYYAV